MRYYTKEEINQVIDVNEDGEEMILADLLDFQGVEYEVVDND